MRERERGTHQAGTVSSNYTIAAVCASACQTRGTQAKTFAKGVGDMGVLPFKFKVIGADGGREMHILKRRCQQITTCFMVIGCRCSSFPSFSCLASWSCWIGTAIYGNVLQSTCDSQYNVSLHLIIAQREDVRSLSVAPWLHVRIAERASRSDP
eukprot:2599078-Amphidinium_carterae.1